VIRILFGGLGTGETLHMSQHEKWPLWIQSPEETSRVWIHGSRFSVPVPYQTQLKHTHTHSNARAQTHRVCVSVCVYVLYIPSDYTFVMHSSLWKDISPCIIFVKEIITQ